MTDPRDAAAPGCRAEGEARSEPTKLGAIVPQRAGDRRSDALADVEQHIEADRRWTP